MTQVKTKNLPNKGKAALPYKGKADGANLPNKGKADSPENLPYKGKALLREESYQGGDVTTDLSVGGRRGGAAQPVPASGAPAVQPGFDLMDIPAFLDRRGERVTH